MKIKWINNGIWAIIGLLFWTCNSKVEIPAYIYVENVDFIITDPTLQGSSSSKITDVWVTVNGKNIGAYQLPALLPVIAEGNTELIFEAGIKLNGLSQQRPKYPLYTIHKEVINLRKGEIDTVFPVFKYQEIVKFPIIEDFENAGLKFFSIDSGVVLRKTNDNSLVFRNGNEPNNFSGIIELPASDNIYFFEIKTTSPLMFNSSSAIDCFVELNFCFTQNVDIGIYCHYPSASSKQVPIITIIGQENNTEWNKIYVNLTKEMVDATTSTFGMTHFDVYMKSGVPKGKTARYLFDNIKIVHR